MDCSLSESVYNALWDLYNSTNGTNWKWSTQLPASTIWTFPSNLSTPCSYEWQGLTCSLESPNSCSLDEIDLNSYDLSGSLPPSLGNMSSLRIFASAENSLSGTIPSELGKLEIIQELNLNTNRLTGTIPRELGDLVSLVRLGLKNNFLIGSIPSDLGNLEILQILLLGTNGLIGTIPSELGNLQLIQELYLYTNKLTGTIPSELGNLQSIQLLSVYANSLSGTIPSELGNLQILQILDLGTNSLTGPIPSDQLTNLQIIQELYLDANSLTGTISSELGNLQMIQVLDLATNCLTGTIPSELGDLQSLLYLELHTNCLTGTIPSEIGNLPSVVSLQLLVNSLTGTISSELGNLQTLLYLDLGLNSLAGTIPAELGNLQSIVRILLYSNRLSGVLNSNIGSLFNLTTLSVSQNSLTGSIPSELAHLNRTLSFIYFFENQFTGGIPTDFASCSLLENIDVSDNLLTGDIIGLANLPNVYNMNAANNFLEGSIPETQLSSNLEIVEFSNNFLIGSLGSQFTLCFELSSVFLGGNFLSGSVPSYLFDLPHLIALDLSTNEFSGSLHAWMQFAKSLQSMDVSMNRLTGTLPSALICLPALVSLNASNNEFSGISVKCSNSSLQSLDVSSNFLTGILPSELFQLNSLQDVLLFNNCFSGSLPESICSNTALEYLVLNHLSSNCASGIPKSLQPVFQGVVSRQLMSGSIPNCVWGISGLRALLLSGNGLKGSIGDAEDSSLRSLYLAGNKLTGTIPVWIQTSSNLEQLDLSQNRLSGTLLKSLALSSNATLFSISVNRLSGDLPWSFFAASADNISLDSLNGNLFSCSFGDGWGSVLTPENLPSSDKNHDSYICGSSLFNDLLLLAAFLFLFLVISVALTQLVDYNDAKNRIDSKWVLPWLDSWRYLAVMSLICGLLLMFYVTLHISSVLAQFSTHSEQYLWMTTAAFLRGWLPTVILLLAIGVGEMTVAMFCDKFSLLMPEVNVCSRFLDNLLLLPFHLLNIVAVVTINSAYVYAIVEGFPRGQLLAIQFFLGCFKLVWNGAAIPWLLRNVAFATHRKETATVHQVFMSLFAFIGGPFMSTFFSASDCFLYTLIPQASTASIVDVPQYTCSPACGLYCEDGGCSYQCPYSCQFQQASTTTSSNPTWIYSYQCSSALLLDYVPVMVASMSVSGLVLPMLFYKWKDSCVALWDRVAPRGMAIGEDFNVSTLGPLLRVKAVVNMATMLTFGLSSPLLGVLVIMDTMIWSWVRQVLVHRQVVYLRSIDVGNDAFGVRHEAISKFSELSHQTLQVSRPTLSDIFIVYSFVGVFWSLFVFDMIGDVYGHLVGGLSMLVPLLQGMILWFAVKCRKSPEMSQVAITRSVTAPGIELSEVHLVDNPVRKQEEERGQKVRQM